MIRPWPWLAAGLAAAVALGAVAGTGDAASVAGAVGRAVMGITAARAAVRAPAPPAPPGAPATTTARAPATPAIPAAVRRDCGFAAAGNDIEVEVTGTPSTCPSWVAWLAADGLDWYGISPAAVPGNNQPGRDGRPMWRVCALSGAVATSVEVMDAAPSPYGTALCSRGERAGWTPHVSTVG